MDSHQEKLFLPNDHEELVKVLQVTGASVLHAVFTAAVELDIFEIMAEKAGPGGHISTCEIVSHIPTQNPEAPAMLDRMFRLLASHSVLTCKLVTDKDGHSKRLYGLAPMCKHFLRDKDGSCVAPELPLLHNKVIADTWYYLKDAVLEGGHPFEKAHGMQLFEYLGKDEKLNGIFNHAMNSSSNETMSEILQTYHGFEGTKEVVDVGGGLGATLSIILSKYPKIKGINFDLPHVLKDAPTCLIGVEHVGGDMFEGVPSGEVILLKRVLHDWNDDQCLKLLKNCWRALPESGKVVVIDMIMPEFPETDLLSRNVVHYDLRMLSFTPGGKERTEREFEALSIEAGFAAMKLICQANSFGIIELYKKMN